MWSCRLKVVPFCWLALLGILNGCSTGGDWHPSFPSIPEYRNAQQYEIGPIEDTDDLPPTLRISFRTSDAAQQIFAFYSDALPKRRWERVSEVLPIDPAKQISHTKYRLSEGCALTTLEIATTRESDGQIAVELTLSQMYCG